MEHLVLSLLMLLGGLLRATSARAQLQAPMTLDKEDKYYIGMDLSASYGAVAVAFSNDTALPIARIEGSEDYKTLLARLARQDRWEPDPPWVPVDPQQVAILSKMIADLKLRAEDSLGIPVNATLVATPALPYLYDTNIKASVQAAGLENMDQTYLGTIFKQPSGALAGWGMGMCHTYWDPPTCRDERNQMPEQDLINVLLTSNAFCVGMGDSKGIYAYQPIHTFPSSMDFTLGYDERHNNPDEAYYWAAIRERILRGVVPSWHSHPDQHVVFVYGDKNAVDDPKFHQVLNGAIHDLLGGHTPIYYPDDPEFLIAKGAARIVRRGGRR